jgi:arylformamidase
MKIHDISVTVSSETPIWQGDPASKIYRIAELKQGDIANVSRLEIGAHTGTHIDAPVHFVAGRKGVDQIPLETLIGPVYVAAFSVEREITAEDLEAAGIPDQTERLLCKTRNSNYWKDHRAEFQNDFVGISASGAEWLVQRKISLVGIDYLGVERFDNVVAGAPTHKILLLREVVILEGLDLSAISPGWYIIICLPIKIKDVDGSPCRAVLVEDKIESRGNQILMF